MLRMNKNFMEFMRQHHPHVSDEKFALGTILTEEDNKEEGEDSYDSEWWYLSWLDTLFFDCGWGTRRQHFCDLTLETEENIYMSGNQEICDAIFATSFFFFSTSSFCPCKYFRVEPKGMRYKSDAAPLPCYPVDWFFIDT